MSYFSSHLKKMIIRYELSVPPCMIHLHTFVGVVVLKWLLEKEVVEFV